MSRMSRMSRIWPGWSRVPRESRDTLFLLGVIGWTVLPHVLHLPLWCGLLTVTVLLWRTRLAVDNAPLPGRWVLVAVLGIAVALTFWSFKTVLGKEPGITLLVVLMGLKTLELRARRDAFVVFFLGFFLVLTHFLYSQSLPVAAAMLISVWGLLTALVLAHMPVGQPSLRQAAALSLRTAALGIPVMLLLFVLFPRIGPLWGVPQDGQATTGLSDRMRMGSMSEVAQDDSIAMRIRFIDPPPAQREMYFRGPVLSRFDGKEWRPAYSAYSPPRSEPLVNGPAIRYEVTLEPLRMTALPLLDVTTEMTPLEGLRTSRRDDLSWNADRPVTQRLRFSATAYTDFKHGPQTRENSLREYVALPPGFNPRTLAWAVQLGDDPRYADATPTQLAQAVMNHIRTGGYSYTLAADPYLGGPDGHGAIDEFWLDRKEGFCEHFASAFVVIMRALGIPARVVTGYQGTDLLPEDGYYLVRQSSAHAWAEYWQDGIGWIRADPTGAVAPDRIDRSRRLAPPPGLVAGALGGISPQFWADLRNAWETANNRWNQWVLNYSRGQQLDLMKRLGFSAPSWEDMALLLIVTLSLLSLLGAAWAWWDRHRQDPWQRQSQQLRRALRSVGITAEPHETPRALAQRAMQRFGSRAQPLAELLHVLDQQRYGRDALAKPSRPWLRALRTQTRALQNASFTQAPR
jgi:transglutaminase-like putative cysteine protease